MTTPERMSIQTFAADLGVLVRTYLRTFDPAAPTDLSSISLEVNGPSLGLIYKENGGGSPTLHVSLRELNRESDLTPIAEPQPHASEDDPARPDGGWFGKR